MYIIIYHDHLHIWGVPITSETDDCYIIGGTERFTKNHLLVIKNNEISIVEKDAFELISEPVEE